MMVPIPISWTTKILRSMHLMTVNQLKMCLNTESWIRSVGFHLLTWRSLSMVRPTLKVHRFLLQILPQLSKMIKTPIRMRRVTCWVMMVVIIFLLSPSMAVPFRRPVWPSSLVHTVRWLSIRTGTGHMISTIQIRLLTHWTAARASLSPSR